MDFPHRLMSLFLDIRCRLQCNLLGYVIFPMIFCIIDGSIKTESIYKWVPSGELT